MAYLFQGFHVPVLFSTLMDSCASLRTVSSLFYLIVIIQVLIYVDTKQDKWKDLFLSQSQKAEEPELSLNLDVSCSYH